MKHRRRRTRICVNAVLPGWFETDLTRGMPTSELGNYIRRKTPAGRWGVGEDLIGPVALIASSAPDFVAGAVCPSMAATRSPTDSRRPTHGG